MLTAIITEPRWGRTLDYVAPLQRVVHIAFAVTTEHGVHIEIQYLHVLVAVHQTWLYQTL